MNPTVQVDDHNFRLPDRNWARCRVQILCDAEGHRHAVLSQLLDGTDGTSLDCAAEEFADELWSRYLPQSASRPNFIRHYCKDAVGTGWGYLSYVSFPSGTPRGVPDGASWDAPPAGLAYAVRRAADPGRGSGHVPQVAPSPTGRGRWVALPVRSLPTPQRLFRAPCMTGPRRWLNRFLQPLGLRACTCYYHQVPWEEVAQAAIAALDAVPVNGTAEQGRAAALLLEADDSLSAQVKDAAHRLLCDPIQVSIPPDAPDFTNGQHRSRAMMDQQVVVVPVRVTVRTGEPLPPGARCLGR